MYGLYTGPKQVAVLERWPLLEVQLYLTEIFLAFVKEHISSFNNKTNSS